MSINNDIILSNIHFLDTIENFNNLRGYQGEQGNQGYEGSVGEEGEQGNTGYRGYMGDTGNQGIKGPKGLEGPRGIKGDKGIKGDFGLQGIQGFVGYKGKTGKKGPKGFKGERGDKGLEGKKGYQGKKGIKGIKGIDMEPNVGNGNKKFFIHDNVSGTGYDGGIQNYPMYGFESQSGANTPNPFATSGSIWRDPNNPGSQLWNQVKYNIETKCPYNSYLNGFGWYTNFPSNTRNKLILNGIPHYRAPHVEYNRNLLTGINHGNVGA